MFSLHSNSTKNEHLVHIKQIHRYALYAYIRDPIMIFFPLLFNRQTIKNIIDISDVYLLFLTTKNQTFPLSDTNGIKGCAYKEIIKILSRKHVHKYSWFAYQLKTCFIRW